MESIYGLSDHLYVGSNLETKETDGIFLLDYGEVQVRSTTIRFSRTK